jgi:opacity protein-like surface antigen
MKRLLTATVVAVAGATLVAPALAQDPPKPNPFPGAKHQVFISVDTVQNSRPKNPAVKPTIGCTQTNFFRRGQGVVFRVWGAETKTGEALTLENVRYLYVAIPGQPNLKLSFGAHGSGPPETRPWFWTVNWDVPDTYPLGVVPFKVLVRMKDGRRTSFSQEGLAGTSRLTITP